MQSIHIFSFYLTTNQEIGKSGIFFFQFSDEQLLLVTVSTYSEAGPWSTFLKPDIELTSFADLFNQKRWMTATWGRNWEVIINYYCC